MLAFTRRHGGETVLAAFNLSNASVELSLPGFGAAMPVNGHGLAQGTLVNDLLSLPGHGALFARVG